MRLPLLASAFALMVVPVAAFADQGEVKSPESFICELTGDCGTQSADVVTREAPETRSFRLATPRTTTQPKVVASANPAGVMLAKPRREAPAPGAARPAPAPVKVAPAKPAPAAGSTVGRVDLRLAFGNGSAILVGRELADVRNLAIALKSQRLGDSRIRIEGHTDSVGSRESNLDLSRRRAQAVAETLVAEGISRDRIDVVGYGYDRPLAGHVASAGANRRVEAVLLP